LSTSSCSRSTRHFAARLRQAISLAIEKLREQRIAFEYSFSDFRHQRLQLLSSA